MEGKETVLIFGATGVIGVSVIIGALRSGLNILAIVRSAESAEKMFLQVGTRDGITTIEADVTTESGVQGVVEMVQDGKLPAFQHVYSTVSFLVPTMPIWKVDAASYHRAVGTALDGQFFAYKATAPYLIEQGHPSSTWTIMTGRAGGLGTLGVSSMGQGALFAMAAVASRENASTNIRFNEVNLGFRINYDTIAKQDPENIMGSSEFARHYEMILARKDIVGSRISLLQREDLDDLKFRKKALEAEEMPRF